MCPFFCFITHFLPHFHILAHQRFWVNFHFLLSDSFFKYSIISALDLKSLGGRTSDILTSVWVFSYICACVCVDACVFCHLTVGLVSWIIFRLFHFTLCHLIFVRLPHFCITVKVVKQRERSGLSTEEKGRVKWRRVLRYHVFFRFRCFFAYGMDASGGVFHYFIF